jgi:hypothetical protein
MLCGDTYRVSGDKDEDATVVPRNCGQNKDGEICREDYMRAH